MKIVSFEDDQAWCEAGGLQRKVNTFLLEGQTLQPGDFLLVHVGYAIQKIDPDEAQKTLELIAEMGS